MRTALNDSGAAAASRIAKGTAGHARPTPPHPDSGRNGLYYFCTLYFRPGEFQSGRRGVGGAERAGRVLASSWVESAINPLPRLLYGGSL